jgi:hypothetical protein
MDNLNMEHYFTVENSFATKRKYEFRLIWIQMLTLAAILSVALGI